jgi:hypothetical protein
MIKLTKAEGIRAGYDKQEGFVDVWVGVLYTGPPLCVYYQEPAFVHVDVRRRGGGQGSWQSGELYIQYVFALSSGQWTPRRIPTLSLSVYFLVPVAVAGHQKSL